MFRRGRSSQAFATRKSFIIIKNRLRFERNKTKPKTQNEESRNQRILIFFPFNFLIQRNDFSNHSECIGQQPRYQAFFRQMWRQPGDHCGWGWISHFASNALRSVRSKTNDPTSHPSRNFIFIVKVSAFVARLFEWRYAFSIPFVVALTQKKKEKKKKKQIIGVSACRNYLFSGLFGWLFCFVLREGMKAKSVVAQKLTFKRFRWTVLRDKTFGWLCWASTFLVLVPFMRYLTWRAVKLPWTGITMPHSYCFLDVKTFPDLLNRAKKEQIIKCSFGDHQKQSSAHKFGFINDVSEPRKDSKT